MKNFNWNERFTLLFNRCLAEFDRGNKDFNSYYTAEDLEFLHSIGYQPREFYDFIEDCGADLPVSTALLVAGVRRAYLQIVQGGVTSPNVVEPSSLPPKPEEVEGIPWLPRLIAKARAKLRGEMHPDTMYGCGGDRMFCSKHDIGLSDFLEVIWHAGADDAKIIDYVKSKNG